MSATAKLETSHRSAKEKKKKSCKPSLTFIAHKNHTAEQKGTKNVEIHTHTHRVAATRKKEQRENE